MGVIEQGSGCGTEMQATVSTFKQSARLASLAFGINPPDLIVVAGDASHTVGPASVNEIVERLIFGGERLCNLKEIHG
jgi:hypothetical protein